MSRNGGKDVRRGGFTLAELLAVMGIVSVLAAIGIPAFSRQLEMARENTDFMTIKTAYHDALTTAVHDAADGELDASYYGQAIGITGIIYPAADGSGLNVTVLFAPLTQTVDGWQHIPHDLDGLNIPDTEKGKTSATFTFTLDPGSVNPACTGITIS